MEKAVYYMRKHVVFLVVVSLITLLLASCAAPEDKVLNSLGKYKSHVFYSEGTFQDFTDYAKYYYDSVDFANNEYFQNRFVSNLHL